MYWHQKSTLVELLQLWFQYQKVSYQREHGIYICFTCFTNDLKIPKIKLFDLNFTKWWSMQIQNLKYPCDKPKNILILWIIRNHVKKRTFYGKI